MASQRHHLSVVRNILKSNQFTNQIESQEEKTRGLPPITFQMRLVMVNFGVKVMTFSSSNHVQIIKTAEPQEIFSGTFCIFTDLRVFGIQASL
jgi:hypothetical protein